MERHSIDYSLLITTLLLMAIGIMMVYSSSAILAQDVYHNSYYFLKKEVIFMVMGIAMLFVCRSIDYHLYYKLTYPLLFLSILLLMLVFIPGLGHRAGGAQRWINVAGFTLQPSEVAKISVIIFMAYTKL